VLFMLSCPSFSVYFTCHYISILSLVWAALRGKMGKLRTLIFILSDEGFLSRVAVLYCFWSRTSFMYRLTIATDLLFSLLYSQGLD
jgi:hypothetical protein